LSKSAGVRAEPIHKTRVDAFWLFRRHPLFTFLFVATTKILSRHAKTEIIEGFSSVEISLGLSSWWFSDFTSGSPKFLKVSSTYGTGRVVVGANWHDFPFQPPASKGVLQYVLRRILVTQSFSLFVGQWEKRPIFFGELSSPGAIEKPLVSAPLPSPDFLCHR
jgi:hypothetical protein